MAEFFVLLVIVYTPSLNVAVLVCIYTAVTANTRIIGKEVSSTRCTDRTSLSVTSASNRQHLRSATAGLLYVPRARTTTRRQRADCVEQFTRQRLCGSQTVSTDHVLAGFKRILKTLPFQFSIKLW